MTFYHSKTPRHVTKIIVIMLSVGLKLAFCPNTTLSVYREGFIAEFMGRTRTAVQAYTSAGTLPISDSARSPEIYERRSKKRVLKAFQLLLRNRHLKNV